MQRRGVPKLEFGVRPLATTDFADWRAMWARYNAFYETRVSENVTQRTWLRLLDEGAAMHGLIAVDSATSAALGFANYVVHPYTWSELEACYLEDLYVEPAARGKGVGRAIFERLVRLAEVRRWDRLYWMTRGGNTVARRLYDRVGTHDDFVRYERRIEVPGEAPVTTGFEAD